MKRRRGDMERIWEEVAASSSRAEPQQINDSVYEVFAPKDKRPSVEIVFFHGLQFHGYDRAQFTTWLSRDQSELWLYWILEKNPNARILTVLYDAHATKTYEQGLIDMYQCRENLLTNFIDAQVGQDGCPVVLVGHGVGGLIMKALCIQANLRLHGGPSDEPHIPVQNFLNHIKALFFFGTPHHGTTLADKSIRASKGPLFKDANTNNKEVARRNEEFRKLRNKYKWKTFGVAEGRKSHLESPHLGTFTGFIVAEASARSDVDAFYTDNTADHFEVCRPHSSQSSSFRQLSNLVSTVLAQDNKERQGHKIGFPDKVIGLQDRVNSVLQELKQERRLGIIGMGGIGKTTLAKTVYNTISHKFEYSCFLPEVKKLFADEENPDTLRATIVKDLYWKGRKESRVIVTSRNAGFLRAERFKCRWAECLNYEDSKRLFCLHAFRESDTLNGFEDPLERIIKKCADLPLALKVAGSYLFGHRKCLWDDAFEKLSGAQPLTGTPKDELSSILTVSYNSLAPAEREVFLDVATFFHGRSLNTAKKIWKLCGWEGVECSWQNLLDKGLVAQVPHEIGSIDRRFYSTSWDLNDYLRRIDKLDQLQPDDEGVRDYIIQMHEVLRDLGRSKACPNPRYVLDHSRVFYNVVSPAPRWLSNQGQPKVEVLEISNRRRNGNSIFKNTSDFQGLKCLRILTLEGGSLEGSFHLFPPTLKYLKLKNFHYSSQSSSHELEQHGSVQYLEIESCSGSVTVLDCLEQLHDLKHLSISHCPGLELLPKCLGGLRGLKYLRISNCNRLRRLPDFQALQHLEILNCLSLIIPHTLGGLGSLEHLEIWGYRSLGTLGSDIGQLTALRHLVVESCDGFDAGLNNLGQLKALEYLGVSESFAKTRFWQALPESLGELRSLKQLRLNGNNGLKELPNTLGALRALEVLVLDRCPNLKSLPETLGQLRALQTLIIQCGKLKALPDSLGQLRALQVLYIKAPLWALPVTVGNLQALECLHVGGGGHYLEEMKMESLPDALGGLHVLKHLELYGLRYLESLPQTLGGLVALEHLTFYDCNESCVADIPRELPALKELEISFCHGLRALPDTVGHLRTLKTLRLIFCPKLETVPDSLGQLESLEHLHIANCPKLKDLPDTLGQLESLERLEINFCPGLKDLPDTLGQLESLECLEIDHCPKLEDLPDALKRRGFRVSGGRSLERLRNA